MEINVVVFSNYLSYRMPLASSFVQSEILIYMFIYLCTLSNTGSKYSRLICYGPSTLVKEHDILFWPCVHLLLRQISFRNLVNAESPIAGLNDYVAFLADNFSQEHASK